MKKLLLFAILLFTITAQAQDKFAIGVKTGFNSTSIKLDKVPKLSEIKNEAKAGFLIGGYAKFKLISNLYLQPEFYYVKKNSNIKTESDTFSSNIASWDLPILCHLQILDLDAVKIYGLAGPVASFASTNDLKNIKSFDDVKNVNWSFNAGGGVSFGRYSAEVRYEWGLNDITKAKLEARTNVITFTLGYKLFSF